MGFRYRRLWASVQRREQVVNFLRIDVAFVSPIFKNLVEYEYIRGVTENVFPCVPAWCLQDLEDLVCLQGQWIG